MHCTVSCMIRPIDVGVSVVKQRILDLQLGGRCIGGLTSAAFCVSLLVVCIGAGLASSG